MGAALIDLEIIPIYVALILSFRRRLVDFLTQILPEQFRSSLPLVMADTLRE